MESPLSFRANWRTTTRNQEGPTTNGCKAQSQQHLFQHIKSNKNWHKEVFSEKLKLKLKKNVTKTANNSRDEARTGITTALLQKGPVFVAKMRSFWRRCRPDRNWTKQNFYQKSINPQKPTCHS